MTVPDWVEDAIFYQIFPDRFANGDPSNDPANVKPWGSLPTNSGFQGGDLRGIIQHFDYLLDLGINAIYLNPIFLSPSTHRYNTTDYFKIDPRLGDKQDFTRLLEIAHQNNLRIVLDGVFNHCGRGFFAFSDILDNQDQSPYRDWFHLKHFPVNAFGSGDATDYMGWWNHKSLPKFNTSNNEVRKYLLSVAKYWLEQGIDGWRLDVPNEIDDDTFWAEFRNVVKGVNPDAYLVGEIWEVHPRWVGNDHFDGLMHYPFRSAIVDLLNQKIRVKQFSETINYLLNIYNRENVFSMYLPLGSHDTERVFTLFGGKIEKVKTAILLQFTYPGAPAIYYGDEIGLEGGKDPDCRRAFPWEQSRWNFDIRSWVQRLISLRKKHPALRRGDYLSLMTEDANGGYAFARTLNEEKIIIAVNVSRTENSFWIPVKMLNLDEGSVLHHLSGPGESMVENGAIRITIPPFSGKILRLWKGEYETV